MLYLSLIYSLPLVALAHLAAWPRTGVARWLLHPTYLVFGLAYAAGPMVCLAFSPPTATLYLTLAVALGVWGFRRHRGGRFWPYSATACLAAYLIAFLWLSLPQMNEYARLRQEFPFESLEDRLPALPPGPRPPLPAPAAGALAELDESVERQGDMMRTRHLRLLHERTTGLFVNSPGFGVARGLSGPSRGELEQDWRGGPPDQPGPRRPASTSPDAEPSIDSPAAHTGLRKLHLGAAGDFVNPEGWGLFRGRDRVAGFKPHRFSEVPGQFGKLSDNKPRWEVETVELVGLLLHPEPVVYVSARLPAMDQLRGAPTRALDGFEAAGLAKLRAGGDLHAAGAADRLRLVGSLRNGKTCAGCHGGEVGDLLGAFTYTLRAAQTR